MLFAWENNFHQSQRARKIRVKIGLLAESKRAHCNAISIGASRSLFCVCPYLIYFHANFNHWIVHGLIDRTSHCCADRTMVENNPSDIFDANSILWERLPVCGTYVCLYLICFTPTWDPMYATQRIIWQLYLNSDTLHARNS